VDDVVVKPEYLPEFLPKMRKILDDNKLVYTIAGHAGNGNFHIIPLMNMKETKNREIIRKVSDQVYGICEGIITRHGVPLNQAASGTDYDGTFTASTETYVATADNLTDKYVKALVRPIFPGDILTMEADAAIGTTTGSDLPGYFIDVLTTDASKLDESNAHATNQLQFMTVDNGSSTNSCQDPQKEGNHILVKLVEAQLPEAVQA